MALLSGAPGRGPVQDLLDKAGFSVLICLEVHGMMLGELRLQIGVGLGRLRVLDQVVTKADPGVQFSVSRLDQVEGKRGGMAFDQVVLVEGVVLAPVLVAEAPEDGKATGRPLEIGQHDHEVDDRLGGHARNGCAADMLDLYDLSPEAQAQPDPFQPEPPSPGACIGVQPDGVLSRLVHAHCHDSPLSWACTLQGNSSAVAGMGSLDPAMATPPFGSGRRPGAFRANDAIPKP